MMINIAGHVVIHNIVIKYCCATLKVAIIRIYCGSYINDHDEHSHHTYNTFNNTGNHSKHMTENDFFMSMNGC